MEHFDVIIIGSGPAGEKAAAQAAYIGKKVLVIEKEPVVGGAMVNTGTLPSKTLRETSLFFSGKKQRGMYGIEFHFGKQITVQDLMFRKNFIIKKEIEMINENLAKHKVKQVHGTAYFIDEHTIGIKKKVDNTSTLKMISDGKNKSENSINIKKLYNKNGEFDYEKIKDVARKVRSGQITITRLNPREEQGRNDGGQRNVEASIISGADARTNQTDTHGGGQTRKEKLKRNAQVESQLEKYAKHEDIWFDYNEFAHKHIYLISGQEAHVYKEQNSNSVLKAVDYDFGKYGISPLEFIDNRISLFNYLFPEAKYELVGFTRDNDGRFRFILRQPFVVGGVVHPNKRKTYMKQVLGVNMESFTPEQYINSDYHIWDLHLKNLIQNDSGEVFVIDALLELNTPERHLGGVRSYEQFDLKKSDKLLSEEKFHGDFILIAVGTCPFRPATIPFEEEQVYDSDEILQMIKIPKSMVIIGAGVIGCEYACMFAALGIEIILIDPKDNVLPFLDKEISNLLVDEMKLLGVKFIFNDSVEKVEMKNGMCETHLKSGEVLVSETHLWAAGRIGNVGNLKLENIGLAANNRGQLEINENYQTKIPHIYAAGDVIGFPSLASTSMEQGRVAMCHAFDFHYKERMATLLPYGIYTIPEVSMVGLTEEEAQKNSIDYEVGKSRYAEHPRGQIIGNERGMLKLIFAKADKKLLGVHVIGDNASEIVHTGMMVMYFDGTIDAFINSVFNYPTLSDIYKYATYDGLGNLSGHKIR